MIYEARYIMNRVERGIKMGSKDHLSKSSFESNLCSSDVIQIFANYLCPVPRVPIGLEAGRGFRNDKMCSHASKSGGLIHRIRNLNGSICRRVTILTIHRSISHDWRERRFFRVAFKDTSNVSPTSLREEAFLHYHGETGVSFLS